MRRRRTALLTLLLLVGLVAVPIVLTWRVVRQERLNHALIAAVDRNDPAAVRNLLRQGADPNAQVMSGDVRPLWQRVVDLLRHGTIPAITTHGSALIKAIQCDPPDAPLGFADRDNTRIVRALADAGADVNERFTVQTTWSKESVRTTPLIEAVARRKWTVMQVLLAHHANVNAQDDHGCTALIYTAGYSNSRMVAALIKQGAQVNVQDDRGETALWWVFDGVYQIMVHTDVPRSASILMEAPEPTLVCLLRSGASVNLKNRRGQTLLTLARNWNDKQLIQMLKKAGAQ